MAHAGAGVYSKLDERFAMAKSRVVKAMGQEQFEAVLERFPLTPTDDAIAEIAKELGWDDSFMHQARTPSAAAAPRAVAKAPPLLPPNQRDVASMFRAQALGHAAAGAVALGAPAGPAPVAVTVPVAVPPPHLAVAKAGPDKASGALMLAAAVPKTAMRAAVPAVATAAAPVPTPVAATAAAPVATPVAATAADPVVAAPAAPVVAAAADSGEVGSGTGVVPAPAEGAGVAATDEPICAICQDTMTNSADDPSQAFPCGHTFHTICVNNWRESAQLTTIRCPCCRTPVTEELPGDEFEVVDVNGPDEDDGAAVGDLAAEEPAIL